MSGRRKANSTPRVAYGCVVGSWEKLRRNVTPWVGDGQRPLMALSGQTALCPAYNTILAAFAGKGFDAVVLLHDDLQITDPLFEDKVLAAMAEDVALVGVAGGTGDTSLHWWESKSIGHQMTDSGLIDFGPRAGDVVFVEGSVMVFSPWAVESLRFDERYPRFAGYDDICVTARAMGKRNVVVDADTHHHSTVGWKPGRREEFDEAEAIFREKWGIA